MSKATEKRFNVRLRDVRTGRPTIRIAYGYTWKDIVAKYDANERFDIVEIWQCVAFTSTTVELRAA